MKKKIIIGLTISLAPLLFLYYYIDIPNPTIREWQDRTDKLIVEYNVKGLSAGDRKVVITDMNAIDAWLSPIETETRYSIFKMNCECSGNPHLKLYEDEKLLATITVHLGSSIRCDNLAIGNFKIEGKNRQLLKRKCASLGIDFYRSSLPVPSYFVGEKEYPRLRFGEEKHYLDSSLKKCPHCSVYRGDIHILFCELEDCPVCEKQVMSCECKLLLGKPDKKEDLNEKDSSD